MARTALASSSSVPSAIRLAAAWTEGQKPRQGARIRASEGRHPHGNHGYGPAQSADCRALVGDHQAKLRLGLIQGEPATGAAQRGDSAGRDIDQLIPAVSDGPRVASAGPLQLKATALGGPAGS